MTNPSNKQPSTATRFFRVAVTYYTGLKVKFCTKVDLKANDHTFPNVFAGKITSGEGGYGHLGFSLSYVGAVAAIVTEITDKEMKEGVLTEMCPTGFHPRPPASPPSKGKPNGGDDDGEDEDDGEVDDQGDH